MHAVCVDGVVLDWMDDDDGEKKIKHTARTCNANEENLAAIFTHYILN